MAAVLTASAGEAPTLPPVAPVTILELVDHKPATPVTHYDRSSFVVCAAGAIVAKVISNPPDPASGAPMPQRFPVDEVKLGKNVAWNADHTAIVATVGGKIMVAGNRISVDHLLEIVQDVGFNVGNVDFDGDVIVRKSVQEKFKVHATGNLSITGTADEAELKAGGDIHVGGGVVGKGKGIVVSGKDTHARFINQAIVTVGGNLHVHNEINGSTVHCTGEVDVTHGSIFASMIHAHGVRCHTIGSQGGIKTVVELGSETDLLKNFKEQTKALAEMKLRRAVLRREIGQLQPRQRVLGPKDKEKLTEFLFEADEIEAQVASITKSLNDAFRQSRAKNGVSLQVSSRLLAGVVVRCPGFETTVKEDLRGPLTIVARREGKETGFVAVDTIRKTVVALPTHHLPDETYDLFKLINAKNDA